MAQQLKNLPAVQETQETRVRFLGREDLLEEGRTTHSSILAWGIPQIEEPVRLQPTGLQREGHDLATEHKLDGGVRQLEFTQC